MNVKSVILRRLNPTLPPSGLEVHGTYCILRDMAEQQAEESTQPELMNEEQPLLSNLDIFLFTLIVGLIIYWFMFRKKPETIPDFRPLEPM
ncbi:hypothetical protein PDJAM_G00123710 [Pangasius djambal]|uniref:Uncharacterized protein n=1 Tax=Pangasius djambal TaxID=1691987 RepID=A0ACC5ZAJ7_9TELE|nr:hypothetical protein [Pangasius djambal]